MRSDGGNDERGWPVATLFVVCAQGQVELVVMDVVSPGRRDELDEKTVELLPVG